MSRPARVTDVEHLGELRLRVAFSDGLVRELDFAPALVGFLANIQDEHAFAQVTVDRVAGTLCWPEGIDFDPDVLHGDAPPAAGEAPIVLGEHQLHEAG